MIANIIYYGADSTGNLYSDEAIVKIFKEFEGIPVVIFSREDVICLRVQSH